MKKWWGDIYEGYRKIEEIILDNYIHGATPDDQEPWETERKEYINRYRNLIGRNLSSMRESAGISYRDLAVKSTVSAATILRYEKGTVVPKYETLYRLIETLQALGLDVQFSDLLKDDHAKPEQYEDVYLAPAERDILESVSMLNARGQEVASERVKELTKISDYTKDDV